MLKLPIGFALGLLLLSGMGMGLSPVRQGATPTPTPQSLIAPPQAVTSTPSGTPTSQSPLIAPPPTSTSTATATPTATFTPTITPTFTATVFPTNTLRYTLTPTLVPGDHFWFTRPFAPDPTGQIADYPARGYAYGSTAGGSLSVHHGIDIQNRTGTWIVAVGSGRVVFAGSDLNTTIGPRPDFYGNAVIIEHDVPATDGRPLYTLYGHISEIYVTLDQRVERGEVIAGVGAEGVAFGPHLHLEVRIGDPFDYYSTYNPELWVQPWPNHGVFAARITDTTGAFVQGIRLELIGHRQYFSGWTYASDTVNPDPYYDENIVIGDMPAGVYDLIIGEARNVLHRDTITIEPGATVLYEFTLPYQVQAEE